MKRSNALVYKINNLAGDRKLTARLLEEYLFGYAYPHTADVTFAMNHI